MRRGFTLVEMSIVLVIVGMILVIVFPAIQAVRRSTQFSTTQNNLKQLMNATAAFAHAHGCLPCPCPASKTGTSFGHVRGDSTGVMCADCTAPEGIPPFKSLGIPPSLAKDGWGRWITMRVDPALAIHFGTQPPTALCTASDTEPNCTIGYSQKGLCAANLSQSNAVQIRMPPGTAKSYAVLFLSHGENGFGAYKAGPLYTGQTNTHIYIGTAGTCGNGSGFERCNADNNMDFVDMDRNNNQDEPFDDFLYYLDRNALIALLGNGACQTEW